MHAIELVAHRARLSDRTSHIRLPGPRPVAVQRDGIIPGADESLGACHVSLTLKAKRNGFAFQGIIIDRGGVLQRDQHVAIHRQGRAHATGMAEAKNVRLECSGVVHLSLGRHEAEGGAPRAPVVAATEPDALRKHSRLSLNGAERRLDGDVTLTRQVGCNGHR